MSLSQVNTQALPGKSIWRDIDQHRFRTQIDQLKRKNEVPGEPNVHNHDAWRERRGSSCGEHQSLPLGVEERIANDIAHVAAARKDVKSVTAVALEEVKDSRGLTIRIAANEAIEASVVHTLTSIFGLLQDCACQRLQRDKCKNEIFNKVIRLHRERIHSRLQSKRGPLSQQLDGLSLLARSKQRSGLKRRFAELAAVYRRADNCLKNTDEELEILKSIVRQSCSFCNPGGRTIEETVILYGFKGINILQNKHIRQINKVGRYWGLCEDLAEASRKYGRVFGSINLKPLPGYNINKVRGIPYHVHAEIQLLTFYGLRSSFGIQQPRVLGVSKSACYLCNLFILSHRQFFITKTHGRLYPLWTVPDLANYTESHRQDVRRVLKIIDMEIKSALSRNLNRRDYPQESFVQLPAGFITSPIGSNLGTLQSNSPVMLTPTPSSKDLISLSSLRLDSEQVKGLPIHSSRDLSPRSPSPKTSTPTPLQYNVPPHLVKTQCTPPAIISNLTLVPKGDSESTVSPSSSSIASWENPIHRALLASSPFHMSCSNSTLFFETEEPSRSEAIITKIHHPEEEIRGNIVDVHALRVGEEMTFLKDMGTGRVDINLLQSRVETIKVSLAWR